MNHDWRKSSYSGGSGGNCVEVADGTGRVLVRDTKDRTGPKLTFTASTWRAFTSTASQAEVMPVASESLG